MQPWVRPYTLYQLEDLRSETSNPHSPSGLLLLPRLVPSHLSLLTVSPLGQRRGRQLVGSRVVFVFFEELVLWNFHLFPVRGQGPALSTASGPYRHEERGSAKQVC